MRCRRRTFTGAGIAAVAVAAVLTLTGCSGDGGGRSAKQQPAGTSPTVSAASPGGTPTTTASAPTASGTPGDDSAQGVEGVWLTTQGGTKVQLVLGEGKAGLTSTHLCGGTYTDKNGLALTMTCMDGDKERTVGHGVLSGDGKTLSVQWTDGPTDTFSRTGLPSN
jgi:hypothetical protein